MSDDLISRRAIKANIEVIRDCWAISPYVSADDIRLYANVFNVVLQCISDCLIAFDKEKVIEELTLIYGRFIKKSRAVEVVEKGGIE